MQNITQKAYINKLIIKQALKSQLKRLRWKFFWKSWDSGHSKWILCSVFIKDGSTVEDVNEECVTKFPDPIFNQLIIFKTWLWLAQSLKK